MLHDVDRFRHDLEVDELDRQVLSGNSQTKVFALSVLLPDLIFVTKFAPGHVFFACIQDFAFWCS